MSTWSSTAAAAWAQDSPSRKTETGCQVQTIR